MGRHHSQGGFNPWGDIVKKIGLRLLTGLGITALSLAGMAIPGGTSPNPGATPGCPAGVTALQSWTYTITSASGVVTHPPQLKPHVVQWGDRVSVTFTIAPNCSGLPITLVSYNAPRAVFDAFVDVQTVFQAATGTFSTGTHTLAVSAPTASGGTTANCPNAKSRNPNFSGHGANQSGAYDSTCDGSPSANGKGNGNANGKPCAGCVGNADNKNPPGQASNGSDHNAGYECDRNQGVGKTNPAHSGCATPPHFQIDFEVHTLLPRLGPDGHGNGIDYPLATEMDWSIN